MHNNDNARMPFIHDVIDAHFFAQMSVDQVLVEYDSPLMFLASNENVISPEYKHWLINWRTGGPMSAKEADMASISGIEKWIAIPVSKIRIDQILQEHISLKEAILLAEDRLFLLEGPNPLEPCSVTSVKTFSQIKSMIPIAEVSVFGNRIPFPKKTETPNSIQMLVHIVPDGFLGGSQAMSSSAAILSCISRYLRRASLAFERNRPALSGSLKKLRESPGCQPVVNELHVLETTRGEAQTLRRTKIKRTTPKSEWTDFSIVNASHGTLTIVGESCPLGMKELASMELSLQTMQETTEKKMTKQFIESLEAGIGVEGIATISALYDVLSQNGLSITLRWRHGTEEKALSVRPSASSRVYDQMDKYLSRKSAQLSSNVALIRVHLSAEEVDALKKEVDPHRGGYQALIADLVKQIDENNNLLVKPDQVEKVIRYVKSYKTGGFQARLSPIYRAIFQMGLAYAKLK